MKLKETSKSVFIVHKKDEDLTCRNVYNICKAKVETLQNDKNIEHVRYVYDKLRKQIERHEKELELYMRMKRRLENEGKTDDDTCIFDKL